MQSHRNKLFCFGRPFKTVNFLIAIGTFSVTCLLAQVTLYYMRLLSVLLIILLCLGQTYSDSFSFPPLPTLVSVGGEVIVLIGQPPLAAFRGW